MSEPFLGQISMFGGNFAPRGWAFCDGQLLAISQNSALFSLLGTLYGGDGRTTFALPDLRGRAPIHWGNGPGLTPRQIGQKSGAETTTLTTANLPSHNHALNAKSTEGNSASPVGNVIAKSGQGDPDYFQGNQDSTMSSQSVGSTGNNQAFNNMQPFLAVSYIIALQGVYPSRN